MNKDRQAFFVVPESVKKDTLEYRQNIKELLNDNASDTRLKAYRVPMGIYGQRNKAEYMVRIRIVAGLVLPSQLRKIAELSGKYGDGVLHITTRQDIQIHKVSIEDTPDVLEELLKVGLSPRGGGGNTVRNITACPCCGVCPNEEFNTAPYAIAVTEYLLQSKSSYNMPRKYKIVFSGCSDDCSFASVADLGFFAHKRDGVKGFSVYAGGGLGSNPRAGIKIEDFIKEDEIFKVAEAVKRLFDAYGDRSNKHRARLRYVLDRKGEKEFIKLYKKYKSDVELNGLESNVPGMRELDFSPAEQKDDTKNIEKSFGDFIQDEKYPGYCTFEIRLRQGDISADDMIKIAEAAENFGQGIVRTTQYQNMLITSVPREKLQGAVDFLKSSGIDLSKNNRPRIISCTGAATCKLGICLSRGLADAITEELETADIQDGGKEKVVRISGCPNSCANHYIANLGFQGRAKRINGRLAPFYDVLFGAKVCEGGTKLAKRIGSVPAKRVPQLVKEYFSGEQGSRRLTSLVSRYAELPDEIPEDFYYDYGSAQPFSLKGRGAGECGAGVLDVIRLDISQGRDYLETAEKKESEKEKSEYAYQALLAAARSLIIIYGLEPKKDREVFTAFRKHLVKPGWVKPQTDELIDDALDWRMGDTDTLSDKFPEIRELISRIEELYLSLDANLEFKVEPYTGKKTAEKQDLSRNTLDLRGVGCPLNFVKAKLELEKLQPGDILEVLLDKGEPAENTPASLSEQGHDVLELKDSGDYCCLKVKRKK